jgi:protein O-GlcNAc transferase
MSSIESLYETAQRHHRAGRLEAAKSLYLEILQRDSLFARAWHLLGVVLHQQGDTQAAIEYIQRAMGLETQWPAFYSNLGTIYSTLGRWHDAEQVLRRGLALAPDNTAALKTLGQVLCELNHCDQAIAVFQHVLALNPNDADALGGLAFAYGEIGLVQESLAAYAQASQVSPDPIFRVMAATQLPLVYESSADVLKWRQRLNDEVDALLAQNMAIDLESRAGTPVFSLAHQGLNDREIQIKLARLYRPPPLPPGVWQPRRDNRIRVGFLSSFFCHHTIGKLTRGLITRLSRADFHVTLFSVGNHTDDIARELAASADRYCLVSRDLARARQQILANPVDMLVFTDIGMDQTTYSLAFSRLAPVQCTTWGHSDTTGVETIDYFVSSDLMETPDADAHYSEKLVRLPGPTLYFYRSELPSRRADRAAFGLPQAARLYACPQSIYKFHPDFDQTLAAILRRDEQGQLVCLRWAYPQADELLRRRLARVMPDVMDRVVFLPRLQQDEYLNLLNIVDVLLDPFPYGGCTSTLEAFSFGVPVVTLPTGLLRGRFTQAFYRRLGVESCIARDAADYVEIALRLGMDKDFREGIRKQILAGQPRLFEDDSAVRDWELFLHAAVAGCV